MPPAPTMPMTVAERVFEFQIIEHLAQDDWQHLRNGAKSDLMKCGPPVEATPSTGLRSLGTRYRYLRHILSLEHAGVRAPDDVTHLRPPRHTPETSMAERRN